MSPGARSSGILSWWTEPAPGAAHEPPLASAHAVGPPGAIGRAHGLRGRAARSARAQLLRFSQMNIDCIPLILSCSGVPMLASASAAGARACCTRKSTHCSSCEWRARAVRSRRDFPPWPTAAAIRIGVGTGAGAGVGRSGARTCSWNEHSHRTMPSLASNERGGGSSAPRTRGCASVRPDVLNGCERSLTCH